MALLIRTQKLDEGKTAAAVRATFAKRATHERPRQLDTPPAEWEAVFDALAKECGLAMNLPFLIIRHNVWRPGCLAIFLRDRERRLSRVVLLPSLVKALVESFFSFRLLEFMRLPLFWNRLLS